MGKHGARRPLVPGPLHSMKKARKVTSEFHRITRDLQEAKDSGDRARAAKAEEELAAIGGRAAYQEASALTTSKHRVAKWVFSRLTSLGMRPGKGEPKLRVLEVGAVNTQLLSVPWLSVRAIDLRSSHPKIEQRDFFELRPEGEFRVVVCSMVLNCVPDARDRGEMLRGIRAHLSEGGVAFIMVPLRCVQSSPHTTWDSFSRAMEVAGLRVIDSKTSPKVGFFCGRAEEPALSEAASAREFPFPCPRIAQARAIPLTPEKKNGAGLKNDFAISFASKGSAADAAQSGAERRRSGGEAAGGGRGGGGEGPSTSGEVVASCGKNKRKQRDDGAGAHTPGRKEARASGGGSGGDGDADGAAASQKRRGKMMMQAAAPLGGGGDESSRGAGRAASGRGGSGDGAGGAATRKKKKAKLTAAGGGGAGLQ